jgi:hypothetical protein
MHHKIHSPKTHCNSVTVNKQLLSAAHTNVLHLHKIRVSEGLYELLDALAKLQRVTIGFVMSVRLSVSMQ